MRQQICDLHEREVNDCEAAVEDVDHIVVEDSGHSWVEDGNQIEIEDECHVIVEDGHPGEGGANDLGEVERLKIRDSWASEIWYILDSSYV